MSLPFHNYFCGLYGREQWSDCVVVFYCRKEAPAAETEATKEPDGKQQAEQDCVKEGGAGTFDKQRAPTALLDIPNDTGNEIAAPELPDGAVGLKPNDGTLRTSSHDKEAPGEMDTVPEPSNKRRRISTIDEAATGPNAAAARDIPIGDPLPSHLVVLCGGSPRFSAQASRWTQEQPPSSKPVLRVPLGDPGELPYALSAVRFIYTGKLDVSGAAALLQLRRLASYLQVEGCVEACDTAVIGFVTSGTGAAAGAGPLAGVTELYGSRHLLPDAAEERSAVQALLGACRQQLVKHGAEYGKQSGQAGGSSNAGPSLGDLLAWAFGDAPSLLSDPEVQRQMEALPAEAMEALLGSDSFATDNEATVLLMLARWLEVNTATTDDVRKRLCKLIRLCKLNATYLHCVLPALPWFPITTLEHRFLCMYMSTSKDQQTWQADAASGMYDCSTGPWYSSAARPTPSSGSTRSYKWYIPQEDLEAVLAKQKSDASVESKHRITDALLVANGFEWRVSIIPCDENRNSAGVYLKCTLPTSLRMDPVSAGHLVAAVEPGPARIVAYKWREDGAREEACNVKFEDDYVVVHASRGEPAVLPLVDVVAGNWPKQPSQEAAASSPDPLAAWAAYLHNREISGVVTWTQP